MSTLERAIALAATLHAGQVDKAGAPYILHPLRVMLRMTTEEDRIAAVLHDVIEDCGVTPEVLLAEGFAPSVVEANSSLTKLTIDDEEEPYDAFIVCVAANSVQNLQCCRKTLHIRSRTTAQKVQVSDSHGGLPKGMNIARDMRIGPLRGLNGCGYGIFQPCFQRLTSHESTNFG